MTSEVKVVFMGYDLELEVLSYTPYTPGVTSGPPEQCFPDEGPEVDWQVKEEEDSLLSALLYENHSSDIEELIFTALEEERIASMEEAEDYLYDLGKEENYYD